MPLLELEKVTRRFGGLVAVDGVDAHVEPNEIFGVIGPNGAGKTTLFAMIAGSLAPTSGAIRLEGEDIANVRLLDRFSFVEVPAERAEEVVATVSGKTVRGVQLKLEVAKR